MNNSVEVLIVVEDQQVEEVIIAELSERNYYSFEEGESWLKAYILEKDFNEEELIEILKRYELTYSMSIILEKNWNSVWESSFSPVEVDKFCFIRTDFHPASSGFSHEIVITPKMSFGTGHHATTYLMVEQMQQMDVQKKSVADFGTGTGILSILAEKLGSRRVLAIDCDNWSIENAKENFVKNNCSKIELLKADNFAPVEKFDLILANINKNVILQNLHGLVFGLNKSGLLLVSGLLKRDEDEIIETSGTYGLTCLKSSERSGWISVLLRSSI